MPVHIHIASAPNTSLELTYVMLYRTTYYASSLRQMRKF